MKKHLLFVMNNLNCGGAEKALISLLEAIDYSRFHVDLYLFKHEGMFLSKLPPQVHLLAEPAGYKYFDMPMKQAVLECFRSGKSTTALSRVLAGYIFKTERNKARCEQRVWRYLSTSLLPVRKKYDAAIGYLEKTPIYFCADKVNADRKIGFIHSDYEQLGMDPSIDEHYFSRMESIVTVSEECAAVLKKHFPQYERHIHVMHNIVSPSMIRKMSLEHIPLVKKNTTIVSVGRLHIHKGFDLAVEACEKLVRNGHNLIWYVIGEGEERERLEKQIADKHLQDSFKLLGVRENPYPYMREADIYVQPSRFEGKSIAIDEAKILGKPIVLTRFNTAGDQISDGENGWIAELDSDSIADAIERLMADDVLRKKLVRNLSVEDYGTESEVQTFYRLVNS